MTTIFGLIAVLSALALGVILGRIWEMRKGLKQLGRRPSGNPGYSRL
jgi:hypothetical protein